MLPVALTLLLALGAPTAEPAQVLWTTGDVRLLPDGATLEPPPAEAPPLEPVAVADTLPTEAELLLEADADARVLVGGAVLAVATGPGRFRVGATGLQHVEGAGRVLAVPLTGFTLGPRPPAVAADPTGPAETGPRALRITSPRHTAITDPEPTLRWRAPAGPARFDFTLWRLDAGGRQVLMERWRGLAGRTHVPAGPLKPGATYRWTVAVQGAASDAAGAADEAWFEVLTADQVREVEGALSALDAAKDRVPRPSLELEVLRARLLESHGLLAAAEQVWQQLADREPDRPELQRQAQRLRRRQLGTPRPRLDELMPFGVELPALP